MSNVDGQSMRTVNGVTCAYLVHLRTARSKMSGRKLNADELKLHQAALAKDEKVRLNFLHPIGNRSPESIDIIHQGCRETRIGWKCPHRCDQLFARGGV